MYCRKCGKFIDYDADICIECKQAEQQNIANTSIPTSPVQPIQSVQPVQPVQQVEEGSVKTGLGKGIAAVILAFFGYILAFAALGALGAAIELGGGAEAGIVLFIMALGTSIPGFVLGLKSMLLFFSEKKAGRKKPIPALILGISGVALAGIAFLGCFIDLILMLAI